MRLFREVTLVEQALVQQIIGMVKEAYLVDICNRTMKLINDTVAGVITHVHENYGQFMPHELLEREDIFKKKNYNPRDLIMNVFSTVEELFEFADITRTSYNQLKAVNIAYVIIHRTGKSGLDIREYNQMPVIQKTFVRFKQFFWTVHQELRETHNLTVEDASMHHAKMVCNAVSGIQETLKQE